MKTIVEALRDLYVALGGSSSDVSGLSLNPDVIEKMATLVTSGALKELPSLTGNAGKVLKVSSGASGVEWGSELPSVTADDNGDVLTVVEGVWGKAAPSGGGGSLTLYGPYEARNVEAVEIDILGSNYFDIPIFYNDPDDGEVQVAIPDSEDDCIPILMAINCNVAAYISEYWLPFVKNGAASSSRYSVYGYVRSVDGNSLTIAANKLSIFFYTTKELEPYTPDDDN